MSDPRVATCVFCDDIRYELGNKLSLMGVYVGGDMVFSIKPPVVYPKMGIAAWLICDVDDRPEHVTITVIGPNEAEIFKSENKISEMAVQNEEGAKKIKFQAILQITPLLLPEEGFLEVFIDTGREKLRAGRLKVKFLEVPTSNAPAQS